jgi:serine protease
MARLSRLLSAVSLGIAATAAVAAATYAVEYAPVRKAPTHRAESESNARVIVKFKDSASGRSTIAAASGERVVGPQRAGVLGTRLGLALADGRALGERTQVMRASGMSSTQLARALAADADVEWAEVDHKSYILALTLPPVNDPLYGDSLATSTAPTGPASGQWYLRAPGLDNSGRNVVSSINIEPAWAITHGATAIVIGDVDTGITQHPDLDSKMLTGYDFIGWGNGSDALVTANDGDLADADPHDPGDYVTAAENSQQNGPFFGCNDDGTGDAVAETSSWHGTQTAGILGAATNNATGMAGSGYDSKVIAARALGKCGGYESDIIAAAKWAGGIAVSGVPTNAHPARVINMSLGATGTCSAAYTDALTALRDKGVVVVVAAGNDAGLPVGTPANCKPATSSADQITPVVVTVAGLRHAGTKVGFSNIGPEVMIAAPGGNCINTASNAPCLYPILTARNSGTTAPVVSGGTYSDGLNNISLGTSFATPMVSGTVALMLSANPNLTNLEVSHILQHTANPFPTTSDSSPQPPVCTAPSASHEQDECICTTSTCGAGMLNAGAAVATAQALLTATAPVAVVAPTTASVQAGSTTTLSGAGSTPGSTGAALTYKWSLASGNAVSLGNTTGASVTLTGVSAGTATVQLTVIDANGMTSTATAAVTVTGASSSGGGGGGAANPAWLLALAIAGLLLGPRARRRGQ